MKSEAIKEILNEDDVKTTVIYVDKIIEDINDLKYDLNSLGDIITQHSAEHRKQKKVNEELKEKVDYLMEAHKYSLSRIIMAIIKKNKKEINK